MKGHTKLDQQPHTLNTTVTYIHQETLLGHSSADIIILKNQQITRLEGILQNVYKFK